MTNKQCDRLIGHAWLLTSLFVPGWFGVAMAVGGAAMIICAWAKL
jgi:hypothetical protein